MTDKSITSFLFDGEITVRVVDRDGELWFVAADVCRALGLTNPAETVRHLEEDERGISTTDTSGGPREVVVVSESGLYSLIFRSRKPNAAHFRKWVTSAVLPTIRRTGEFVAAQQPTQPCSLPEPLALRMVRQAQQTHGTRAAQQLWFKLGLPCVPAMQTPTVQADLFVPWVPLDAPAPPAVSPEG